MTMKTQIILFAWLCSGLNLLAQPAQLTREAYRDRVENYSQVLKQQKLKSMTQNRLHRISATDRYHRRRYIESQRNGCLERPCRTIS